MRHESAKKIFQENIKKYLKRAKLRQLYLASLLGVTSSAVCQMLKCRIVMNHQQLQTVCKGLKLSLDESLELQTLLSTIRHGNTDLRSPFNKLVKSYRREHRLSIARLAQISGISRIRLKAFENDFNAEFTMEDAEKLAKIYECSAEFLMSKYTFINTTIAEYTNRDIEYNNLLEIADNPVVQYADCKQVNCIALSEFINFSNNADLFVFGDICSKETIPYNIEKQVIGICASSAELEMPFDCDIIMFVSDKKPLIYVCRLFLCMTSDRKFIILQQKEDCEGFFDMSGKEYVEKVRWSLGIVEMKITPKFLV